jgi:hypothetical protein
MSNNITAFLGGLYSTYEGEHAIFGLLSLMPPFIKMNKLVRNGSVEKLRRHGC